MDELARRLNIAHTAFARISLTAAESSSSDYDKIREAAKIARDAIKEITAPIPEPKIPRKEVDLTTVKGKVLMAIRSAGEITADRVESETGLTHQSASARIRELVQAGLVGIKQEKGKSKYGRSTRIYFAVQ